MPKPAKRSILTLTLMLACIFFLVVNLSAQDQILYNTQNQVFFDVGGFLSAARGSELGTEDFHNKNPQYPLQTPGITLGGGDGISGIQLITPSDGYPEFSDLGFGLTIGLGTTLNGWQAIGFHVSQQVSQCGNTTCPIAPIGVTATARDATSLAPTPGGYAQVTLTGAGTDNFVGFVAPAGQQFFQISINGPAGITISDITYSGGPGSNQLDPLGCLSAPASVGDKVFCAIVLGITVVPGAIVGIGEVVQWIDPPIAAGYDYQAQNGAKFTQIADFPTGFDHPFQVSVGGNLIGTFGPGQSALFPSGGVSEFSVTGISPAVDPTNQLAFPLKVGVDTSGALVTMTSIPPSLDTTPPVIVPNVGGTLGNNGWYRSGVIVTWSISDPESGITSSTGCATVTLTTDTAGVNLTCSATNGAGLSSSISITIKIDQTAPVATVALSPASNGAGWNNTNVTANFNGTDALSGIASCSAPVTLSTVGAGQTVSGTCTDLAGNVSSSATASVNIDKTAPTVIQYRVLFGSQSYNLIGSIRRHLPWQISGIQVVFSKPILAGNASSLGGVIATGFAGLGTNTLTWTFSPIALGNLSTVLSGSGANALTDIAGNGLAGGAGFSESFKVLQADFNDDGAVSSADLVGINSSITAAYNVFADITGDGVVNSTDVAIARTRIGTTLP